MIKLLLLMTLASEPTDYDRQLELVLQEARTDFLKTGLCRTRLQYDCGDWKFIGRRTPYTAKMSAFDTQGNYLGSRDDSCTGAQVTGTFPKCEDISKGRDLCGTVVEELEVVGITVTDDGRETHIETSGSEYRNEAFTAVVTFTSNHRDKVHIVITELAAKKRVTLVDGNGKDVSAQPGQDLAQFHAFKLNGKEKWVSTRPIFAPRSP